MGTYEQRFWLNDTWGASRAERQSGTYFVYHPDRLMGLELDFSARTTEALAEAHYRLGSLDSRALESESIGRLLLRSEAISSSMIEGLEVPVQRLMEAEALRKIGINGKQDDAVSLVLSNIEMMEKAIEIGKTVEKIDVDTICGMHKLLLKNTRYEDLGGNPRSQQNWVGGNNYNPIGAAYVPPPPEEVVPLLEDLAQFARQMALPDIAKAAIVHAQFETIHPFIDGNGRCGRALVHAILARSDLTMPISLVLAADKERYIENLAGFRTAEGENQAEAVDRWVGYFAEAAISSYDRVCQIDTLLSDTRSRWDGTISFRQGSAGEKILEILPSHPVITVQAAAGITGKSEEACRQAIQKLSEAGILVQNSRNRKSNIFVAQDIVEVMSAIERACATKTGDTATEKPKRNVPQRDRKAKARAVLPSVEKPTYPNPSDFVYIAHRPGDPDTPRWENGNESYRFYIVDKGTRCDGVLLDRDEVPILRIYCDSVDEAYEKLYDSCPAYVSGVRKYDGSGIYQSIAELSKAEGKPGERFPSAEERTSSENRTAGNARRMATERGQDIPHKTR